jgi:hypothetical protein
LPLAAHQHQLPPYRFDAPRREAELRGAGTPVIQNAAFSLEVTNPNPMLSLARSDVRHDLHPLDQEIQELVVESVKRSPQLGKRSFVWILAGHELVLHRRGASA